jgi:hypothetical protein
VVNKFEGIKEGDHVRVVVEGTVTRVYPDSDNIELGEYVDLFGAGEQIVSVERFHHKFGPGDIVRSKGTSGAGEGTVWQILRNGYVRLGKNAAGNAFQPQDGDGGFTSEHYELVDLT